MFASVLVANRGEIAARIARTARRLGMRVIAIYADVEAGAYHCAGADETVCIGGVDGYLDGARIIAAAREKGAECIHPGYGFLAENAAFAESCAAAGVCFVGPPPAAIAAMGEKSRAKHIMEQAKVPVVPGYHGEAQDEATLAEAADAIGYPVLIKAVAGGGGKGMRRVDSKDDFQAALEACRREAASAFGDERVLVEKFIASPRHIEVQVFADNEGGCVHLFERDCSLQRRHQKIIEEAPAPGLGEQVRAVMGEAAVKAARAVDYVGAGTVEFIVDGARIDTPDCFHFMEMNTRLQVEHPVTEMITGIDLVEWQFLIASGRPLPVRQEDIARHGHAIEVRLYAEDPANGFVPQTGNVRVLHWPQGDGGVRVDPGIAVASQITPHFDPMAGKVIAHGNTRAEAAARLASALTATTVAGVATNAGFLINALASRDFLDGDIDTGFVERHLADLLKGHDDNTSKAAAAALWLKCAAMERGAGPWSALSGWRLTATPARQRLAVNLNGADVDCEIDWRGNDLALRLDEEDEIEVAFSSIAVDGDMARVPVAGKTVSATIAADRRTRCAHVLINGWHYTVRPRDLAARDLAEGEGAAVLTAPMAGRVVAVIADQGATVARGEAVVIVEAMKMEHVIAAGFDARVVRLGCAAGDQVGESQPLAWLEAVAAS